MEYLDATPAQEKNAGDLKRQIQRYLRYWPWFLGTVLLALTIAYVYLRYTTPQFMSKSSLYVQTTTGGKKGDFTGIADMQAMALPSGFGTNEVDNEISIIQSKPLMLNVVKKLNLDVKLVREGKIREADWYVGAPVKGSVLELNNPRNFGSKEYTLTPLKGNAFKLSGGKKEISGYYGTPVKDEFGSFVLHRISGTAFNEPVKMVVTNPRIVADRLEASITVVIPQKKSSILELSRVGVDPVRSEDILNEIMAQYNAEGIRDRNAEAVATAKFVDERLDLITQELGGIESQKENFKEANRIADLQAQAQLSLQNASENTKKLMDLSTQLEMVDAVLQAASSSSNEQLLPTNVGMPSGLDPIISEYNQLVITRNRTAKQATGANPSIVQFNKDIASMRDLIRDNLRKSKAGLQQAIGQIQGQINKSSGDLSRFPQQERMFRNIERQQNLKEALFLYLLQKREETSLAMAVTAPKAKVVNPAYTQGAPVAPKKNIVYLTAFLLGLLIPGAILYTRFALDTYVHNRKQIRQAIPDAVILGEIPNAGKDSDALIKYNDFSSFAEAFRIMFTNMKFMLKKVPQGQAPVILVTSSVKGEGKTTISVNTALTLAQNRKVLLIGADIRNPQLKRFMEVTRIGLSDFLADASMAVQQVIAVSPFSEKLDILHSGTIPPNPTELLDSPKFGTMLEELKTQYDYIVIDTAPVMMVSDSYSLMEHADLLLFVMRAEHTDKEMLEFADQLMHDKAKGKMGIVLNDVQDMHLSYGNKYGYGYYTESRSNKKSWLSRMKI